MENGPLRSMLRVTQQIQPIHIKTGFYCIQRQCRGTRQGKTGLEGETLHAEAGFPCKCITPAAAYEIPYGFIDRPANGEEEPGQQWIDVTGKHGDREYGLSLINNSKYSFSVHDSEMRMTVANSSIYNDHYGDRDEWCEFMDQVFRNLNTSWCPMQAAGSLQHSEKGL